MSSSTPSIRISQHQRYPSPPGYSTSAASPMAIPSAEMPVPPPLPPPTHIPDISAGHDPGWQWGNDPNKPDFGRLASVKPGSSLLGGTPRTFGFRQGQEQEQEQDTSTHRHTAEARRESSMSTVTVAQDHDMIDGKTNQGDEDTNLSRPWSEYRLNVPAKLEQRTLEQSSNSYDKQLLSRIGGPNTPKRQSISYSAGNELPQLLTEGDRRNGLPNSKSLPERRHVATNSLDSPASARWPSSGAVSPGFTGFWPEHGPPESRAPTRHGSIQFDESASHRGSYDHSMFINDDPMEEGPMSNLRLHDRSPSSSEDAHLRAGSKRRASSPPRESAGEERGPVSNVGSQHDMHHRRSLHQLPNRGSPLSRFHPNHSSVSSASSFAPRHGSLTSSLGVSSIPSSATSYGSGRLSPGGQSSAVETNPGTPYGSAKVLAANHERNMSEGGQPMRRPSVDLSAHSRQSSLSHVQGIFMCECCPKKPKKFNSEGELRMHESEKQYTCAYCPNRFKNKNEAERHQNSLHLRKHSWSCAALFGVEAAYHASQNGNGTDVCGFCGQEFSNPPQWDLRAEHLNQKHKFGDCNLSKKFFRADHFRQHLKHSHAGSSGKWTNMLENACMKDEPPPEKMQSPGATIASGPLSAPTPLTVSTTGLTGQSPGDHEALTETPHDS